MFTVKNVVNGLKDSGYNATYREVTKNGVTLQGVTIREDGANIAPVIYLDKLVEQANAAGDPIEKVINEVIRIYEANKPQDVNAAAYINADYILNHISVGVQRAGNEDIVKRNTELEGIEEYLYINCEVNGQGGTIKLKKDHLTMAGLDASKAWHAAYKNLRKDINIIPMGNMIPLPVEADLPMFVISNTHMNNGAAAALDTNTIKGLADKYNFTEYYLIPSSRHEVIIVPDNEKLSLEMISSFVKEVNAQFVDPVDQLADRAYKLTA